MIVTSPLHRCSYSFFETSILSFACICKKLLSIIQSITFAIKQPSLIVIREKNIHFTKKEFVGLTSGLNQRHNLYKVSRMNLGSVVVNLLKIFYREGGIAPTSRTTKVGRE